MGRPDLDRLAELARKATHDPAYPTFEQLNALTELRSALSPEVVLWLCNVAKAAHLLFDDPDNCDDHDRELAKALDAVPGQGET